MQIKRNRVLSSFVGILNISSTAGCRPRGGILDGVPAVLVSRTLAAEQRPSNYQQPGRTPANEERGAELPTLGVVEHGVVEVPDDLVGRPGNRDEAEDATHDEEDASADGRPALGLLVLDAVGAFSPCNSQQEPHKHDQDGDDHQRPSCLQVPGQRQHGVVHLALHLASALLHAVHPQALPEDLGRHNVVANEG